jgi:hypothetical protein
MLFLRIISLFCAVALLLAFAGDVLLFVLSFVAAHMSGNGAGLLLKPPAWIGLFFAAWTAAFAIGVFISIRFHVFPFGLQFFPFMSFKR